MIVFFLTEITIQPINFTTVLALESVTLSCLASIDDVRYSWHHVDGHIPSSSQGRHNNTFTIHRITPDSQGTYYCVVKKHEIIVRSNNTFIAVDGTEYYNVHNVTFISIITTIVILSIIITVMCS